MIIIGDVGPIGVCIGLHSLPCLLKCAQRGGVGSVSRTGRGGGHFDLPDRKYAPVSGSWCPAPRPSHSALEMLSCAIPSELCDHFDLRRVVLC